MLCETIRLVRAVMVSSSGSAYQIFRHLFNRFIRNWQAMLLFCYGKVKPQLTPGIKAILRVHWSDFFDIERWFMMSQ
jgi:hypothetical protein